MSYVCFKRRNEHCYGNEKELYVAAAFAISYCLLTAKNILIQGSPSLYNANSKLNMLILIVSVLLYAYAILVKDNRLYLSSKQIFVIGAIISFWFLTYMFNENLFTYSYVEEELVFFLTYCLPALLILPGLRTCKLLLETFYKCRWFLFGVVCLAVILMLTNGQIQGAGTRSAVYSMAFGRALLLPCILLYSHWFKERKKLDLLGGIVCTLFIFLFGSRFPLLCIAAYIGWKLLQSRKSARLLIFICMGFVLVAFIIVFSESILAWLNQALNSFGIQSRALSLINSGKFGYDDGRLLIYNELIAQINKSPIIGYGAGGGNVALGNGLSHSFILDVFANLGYVFGGLLLIVSAGRFSRLYRKNRQFYNREFIIICLCLFVPMCAIQMSLWRATYYWYLLALSLGRLRTENSQSKRG